MLCLVPDGSGIMSATLDTVETCAGVIALDATEFSMYQQAMALTPEQVLYLFGWGFGTVMLFWFFGFVIGSGKKGVRSL